MNTATKARPIISLKGKGAATRAAQFERMAAAVYADDEQHDEVLNLYRSALGKTPSAEAIRVGQQEWIIGMVARRLPVSELPKGCRSAAQRIEYARDVVCHYAKPVEEGKTAYKLRKGQKGRRSAVQHRMVRTLEQRWSYFAADVGIGTGQTKAENNKKTRAAQMAGSTKRGKAFKVAAPLGKDDLPAAKEMTPETMVLFFNSTSATLEAFARKYAAELPIELNEVVEIVGKFRTAALKASNAYEVRKAKADAKPAKA